MEPNPHMHVKFPAQPGTDNSQQQKSTEADVSSTQDQTTANQSQHHGDPVFYREMDNPTGKDDAEGYSRGSDQVNNNNNTNNDNDTNDDRKTDHDAGANIRSAVQELQGSDFERDQGRAYDEDVTRSENPHEEDVFASGQDSGKSTLSRAMPSVQRANSSPLTTVCRPSHCHLPVVKCQVTSHNAPHSPHLSTSSCPAAFSPVWTRVVPPVPTSSWSKARSKASAENKRRYTVGPTTQSAQELQQLQQRYSNSSSSRTRYRGHSSWQGCEDTTGRSHGHYPRGVGEEEDDDVLPSLGRERSWSDSELQYMVTKEVGRQLRKMSDEFHCVKTGGKTLTTLEETGRSNNDSSDDDEVM